MADVELQCELEAAGITTIVIDCREGDRTMWDYDDTLVWEK
jgi:hypothetical protein